MSLRRKLLLSISIPLLATYVGLLAWDYSRQKSAATDEMQSMATERAQSAAAALDARLTSVIQVAESTATILNDRPTMTDAQLTFVLNAGERRAPWIAGLYVAFDTEESARRGDIIALRRRGGPNNRTPTTQRRDVHHSTEDWFNEVKSTQRPKWLAPQVDVAISPDPICTYVYPLMHNGAFRGVVAASIRASELGQLPQRRDAAFTTTAPFNGFPFDDRGPGGDRPFDDRGDRGDRGERRPGERLLEGPFARRIEDRLDNREPRDEPTTAEAEAQSIPPDLREILTTAPSSQPSLLPLPPTAQPASPIEETSELASVSPRDFIVINEAGRIISTSDPTLKTTESVFDIAERRGVQSLARAGRDALSGKSGVVRIKGAADLFPGQTSSNGYHWIAFAPISATGWAFAATLSESSVMEPILTRIYSRALFLLAGMVVLIGVAMIVAIRISRPIEQLAGAVQQLGRGNLDVRVTGIRSHDEIGQLASGFNRMVGELKRHVDALTEQSAVRARTDSELKIARKIQTDLLPREFPVAGDGAAFDLFAVNEPAMHVAGDFYDFFFAAPGKLFLVVADVAGKGVPAALMMAVTRTVIRDLAGTNLGCGQILDRANIALARDSSSAMFVTAFVAQYDVHTGVVTFVNAGHPQPIVRRVSGGVEPIAAPTSALLGVFTGDDAEPYVEHELTLAPGDALVMFTDGVTEARSPADVELGTAGLASMLGKLPPNTSAEAICRDIAKGVDAYQHGKVSDDLTVLAIQRRR